MKRVNSGEPFVRRSIKTSLRKRQRNEMWRRAVSAGLALLLLFLPWVSYAAGEDGDEALPDPPVVERPWDAPPQVTLAAVNISGTPETLELRMEVAGGSNFKSAGAVLRYDATKLKLISWDSAEDVLTEANRCSDPAIGWSSGAAILPTKGPDDHSSKQSKGYLSEDGSEGYLYLAAESMLAQTFAQDQYVAALRFAYVESAPTPSDGGVTATVGSIVPGETIGFVGGGKAFADLTDSEKEILLHSPLGAKMEYGEEDRASLTTKLWYLSPMAATTSGLAVEHPGKTDNLLAYPGNVDFEVRETGESVNTGSGPANPDDFASIVLYDWDETLLGSIIVPKGADATELIDAFVKERSASAEQLGGQLWYNDPGLPFTYKKGYSLQGWIDYSSDTYTNSGYAVSTGNGNIIEEIPDPEPMDFSNVNDNLIIKAVYKANEDMVPLVTTGALSAGRNYTVSLAGYSRFSTTVNYSVKVKVERNNQGEGVPRTRDLALRVVMTTDNNLSLYSLVTLDNKDEVIAEIVPNNKIKKISATVIDMGGVSNWVNGTTARSEAMTCERDGEKGFVLEGNVTYVNEMLATKATALAASVYTDADLSTDQPFGIDTTASVKDKRAKAWENMLTVWWLLNPDYGTEHQGEVKFLTHTELQNAIDNGRYIPEE